MARFEFLIDGKGRERVRSEDDVRAWLRDYREQHAEDDPDAMHVQVRELTALSWLTGGKLVERKRFFESAGPTGQSRGIPL